MDTTIVLPATEAATPATAVIYCRTSREDREDLKVSIEVQQRACLDLAEKNGLRVLNVYVDRNQSGRMWPAVPMADHDQLTAQRYGKDRRQAFTEVVKLVEKKTVPYVLAYSPDRLARPLTGLFSGWLEQLFMVTGVHLWTVTAGKQDLADFAQGLVHVIQQRTVSGELEKNRQTSMAAKKMKRDQGLLVAPPCLGYRSAGPQKVAVDETEADTVRLIFDLFAIQRFGLRKLIEELVRQNRPTRHGKTWQAATVLRVLANPSYIGKARNSGGELIDSSVYAPIIDRELWLKTQGLHRQWRGIAKRSRRFREQCPLSGTVLVCGHCGKRLTAHRCAYQWRTAGGQLHRASVDYYQCQSNSKCKARAAIKAADAHALIRGNVQDGTLDWLVRLVRHVEPFQRAKAAGGGLTGIEELERRLADLTAARSDYIARYSDQPRTLTPLLDRLHEQEVEAQRRLTLAIKELPVGLPVDADIGTAEGLRQFGMGLFNKIEVYIRDRVVIHFREHLAGCPATVTVRLKRSRDRRLAYTPLSPAEKTELAGPNTVLCPPPAATAPAGRR